MNDNFNSSNMNATIKRAIFLDFDGVLFDTVKEAYCVCMIALGKASDISNVNLKGAHFQEFFKFRFLVGPAWNYYYLMPLIDEKIKHPPLNLIEAFRVAIQNSDPEIRTAFEKCFFGTRNSLRETGLDSWLSLITPYAFVNDLRDLLKDHPENFFVITTRDRSSVLHILQVHHLGFFEDSVFGGEEYGRSNSKKGVIQRLIGDHQIEEAIFIDDLEDHIADCGTIENLSSIHARWGYVSPDKKEDNSARVMQGIQNFFLEKNVWN